MGSHALSGRGAEADLTAVMADAEARRVAGDLPGTIARYRDWLAAHGDHPLAHVALFNLGVAFGALPDPVAAEAVYRQAIARQPAFVEARLKSEGEVPHAGVEEVLAGRGLANLHAFAAYAAGHPASLTSAEVLASGLDLLIYKPLPGPEEGNAAFLQQYCGALVARSTDELVQHFKNSTVSPREAAACSEHAHPLAAQQIVDYVMQRLQK